MSTFTHTHTEEIYLTLGGIGGICVANLLLSYFSQKQSEIRACVIIFFVILGLFCADYVHSMKNLGLLIITLIPFALCSISFIKINLFIY